ncbi:MAG: UDP-N-acetylglucosamine 1-carboxyvinyltransferase [Alphaproteobacteria bacterium]|nr:UDP-N-acetylglucosamine 1-carboxyvinyltransferase [Alphaproteobacteria bacterium]
MTQNATTKRARALRNNPTEAEKALWWKIRAEQLGVKFRRQYPMGPYYTDFACKEKNLVIELDGGQHAEQVNYDEKRTAYLEEQGYTVLRFWNSDVLDNMEGVLTKIMNVLETSPLPPDASRLPPANGGIHPLSPRKQGDGRVADEGEGKTIELIRTEVKTSGLDKIRIRGGNRLNGTIPISGAKNAALKLICASLLTDEPLQLTNMPVTLGDIRTMGGLLDHIGVTVALRSDKVAILRAKEIKTPVAPYDLVRKMRASIMVLGPLLARHHAAEVSLPGGCAIGTRPVDFHIEGLRAMGAEILIEDGYIKAKAPNGLKGAHYTFPKVSHTGTENLMMAATLAEGTTLLSNAAREPEVENLGQCLIAMGARIEGLGTPQITIHGVPRLHGATHEVMPDRIEAGSFMIAVALTGGTIRLQNIALTHLTSLTGPLEKAGLSIEQDGADLIVSRNGKPLVGTDIMTEPYPGFPTDMQAQFMTMLTLCMGAGLVTETIFENRFMHVPELCRMGANITVHGNSAIIRGVEALRGAEVMATDLRASMALVLAGLVANGETVVNRIYHLDRGYEDIVGKLTACGAQIERLKS